MSQFRNGLIAAAVIAAMGASANAAAEATVYGKIHMSFGNVNSDTGTSYSANALASHASRLGVKASKELESGLTVGGKAEFEVDWENGSYSKTSTITDSNGDTASVTDNYIFKARNVYLSLKGGFGEFRAGHMDTPHKVSTAKLDPLSDAYADYNNIITNDNRAVAIAYLNSFGPVGFAAAYVPGNDTPAAGAENSESATSVMVNYSAGDLYLSAAVESFSDVTAGLETASKFGVGYTFGPAKLGLVYENLGMTGGAKDETETYASLQYKMDDANTVIAAYGMRDDGVSATNDEVLSMIGLKHKLDKSAELYAQYANGTDGGLAHKGKLAGDASAFVVGAIVKF